MAGALDREAVAAVDPTGQAAEIADLATHLRDALWRVDSAGISPADAAGGLVVAGVGGSGVGALLARTALGQRLRRPFLVSEADRVPPWTGPEHLVLCSSYSGRTQETVAAYDDARERGAPLVVATTGGPLAQRARRDGVPVVPLPGGFQPRAAVGYGLVACLEVAALAGAAPAIRDEIEAAAALAERLAAEWGPDGPEDGAAKALARRLHGTVPVVAGGELLAPVAYRWKCQLNENASMPAFWAPLPEAAHNEVAGWPAGREFGPFSAVFLEDPAAEARDAARSELMAAIAGEGARVVEHVPAHGETRLERLVSLVLLGDLVSLYLAVLRDVDPADVEPLDRLKAALADR